MNGLSIETTLTNDLQQQQELKVNHSILERTRKITNTKNLLYKRAETMELQEISLMVYGSSSYNFFNGGLNDDSSHIDFDGIACIGDLNISYKRFAEIIKYLYDEVVPPPENILQGVLSGSVGIMMIKGKINGEEINFHFLSKNTLQELISGIGHKKTTTLFLKTKPVFNKMIRECVLGSGVIIEEKAEAVTYDRDDNFWLVRQNVSRKISTGDVDSVTKGILADKLLSSTVIWDPSNNARKASKRIWMNYVRSNLFYNPEISDEKILEMIHNSHKFSVGYKTKLLRRIKKEREILNRRKSGKEYSILDNSLFSQNIANSHHKDLLSEHPKIPERNQNFYLNQIETYYNLLSWTGIDAGEIPDFSFDGDDLVIDNDLEASKSGNEYFLSCTEEKALAFFEEIILQSILLLVEKQKDFYIEGVDEKNLYFSINPSPELFFLEEKNDSQAWVYRGYVPPLLDNTVNENNSDLLSKVKIWNSALIQATSLRPELFQNLYKQIIAFLKKHNLHKESLYIQEYY